MSLIGPSLNLDVRCDTEKTGFEIVPSDHEFEIPYPSFKCPYCGSRVVAHCESWEEDENGMLKADMMSVDCIRFDQEFLDAEKTGNEIETERVLQSHMELPYVYWLPLVESVTEYINRKYRFDKD